MQLGFSRAIHSRELGGHHPSGQIFGVSRGSEAAQGLRIHGHRALGYRSSRLRRLPRAVLFFRYGKEDSHLEVVFDTKPSENYRLQRF